MTYVAKPLIFLITVLIIISSLTSYFILQIYGIQVSGLELPSNAIIDYSSNQDFANNNINTSILYSQGAGLTYYKESNDWAYIPTIGRVLTQPNPIGNPLLVYLCIDKIQPDSNGVITNAYIINNTVKSDYSIILRLTGGYDQNEIIVKKDGFHIPTYILPNGIFGEKAYYPYDLSNQKSGDIIKTVYNDKEFTVSLWYNDIFVFSSDKLSPEGINPLNLFSRYYGGIGGYLTGFTIVNFNSENIISGSNNVIDVNPLNQVVSFFAVMAKIIIWNIDEAYLPTIVNLILIKPFVVGIIICIFVFARG